MIGRRRFYLPIPYPYLSPLFPDSKPLPTVPHPVKPEINTLTHVTVIKKVRGLQSPCYFFLFSPFAPLPISCPFSLLHCPLLLSHCFLPPPALLLLCSLYLTLQPHHRLPALLKEIKVQIASPVDALLARHAIFPPNNCVTSLPCRCSFGSSRNLYSQQLRDEPKERLRLEGVQVQRAGFDLLTLCYNRID